MTSPPVGSNASDPSALAQVALPSAADQAVDLAINHAIAGHLLADGLNFQQVAHSRPGRSFRVWRISVTASDIGAGVTVPLSLHAFGKFLVCAAKLRRTDGPEPDFAVQTEMAVHSVPFVRLLRPGSDPAGSDAWWVRVELPIDRETAPHILPAMTRAAWQAVAFTSANLVVQTAGALEPAESVEILSAFYE